MNELILSNKEQLDKLIEQMHSHIAWYGDITGKEAEKVLKFFPVHTYLLRKGENELHYFLSHVQSNSVVFHESIRINPDLLGYYPNGGGGCDPTKIFKKVEPIICEFLKCSLDDLLPLSNSLSQVQGF